MRFQLYALIGLQVLASQASAQNIVPWRILGDTSGPPRGCTASEGAAAISLFVAAIRKADSVSLERSVAPAAEMAAAREILELPAGRGGDEHAPGVRVAQRGVGARAAVGDGVEQRVVLVTVAARDDATVLEEQHDAGRPLAVEALRDRTR